MADLRVARRVAGSCFKLADTNGERRVSKRGHERANGAPHPRGGADLREGPSTLGALAQRRPARRPPGLPRRPRGRPSHPCRRRCRRRGRWGRDSVAKGWRSRSSGRRPPSRLLALAGTGRRAARERQEGEAPRESRALRPLLRRVRLRRSTGCPPSRPGRPAAPAACRGWPIERPPPRRSASPAAAPSPRAPARAAGRPRRPRLAARRRPRWRAGRRPRSA